MDPDYSQQIERLIAAVSHKDPVPAWVISLVSVVVGAVMTALLGVWKERRDAKRRRTKLERAVCGEILLNHSALLGTLMTKYQFDRIKPTQTPFGGMFTFDALENAKAHGDVLYDVPNFAAMRTLYKMYQGMAELHGGGAQTEALASDGVRAFETLFVQGNLDQRLFITLCGQCAPNLTPRLQGLAAMQMKPGQLE
jgi:hypothetical protein